MLRSWLRVFGRLKSGANPLSFQVARLTRLLKQFRERLSRENRKSMASHFWRCSLAAADAYPLGLLELVTPALRRLLYAMKVAWGSLGRFVCDMSGDKRASWSGAHLNIGGRMAFYK